MIVKGQITGVGESVRKQGTVWKMQTNYSEIEVGGQRIKNVVVPDVLEPHFKVGDTVELLILKFYFYERTVCGIRVNGEVYKCGAANQLTIGLVLMVLFGWLIVTMIPGIYSLRNYLLIDQF